MARTARTARTVELQHQRPYPTVLPPEETQPGVAAPQAAPSGPVERRPNGQVDGTEAAAKLGRQGGLKRAERRRTALAWGLDLGAGLGRALQAFKVEPEFVQAIENGERWYEAQLTALARDVGGGVLSPAVCSIVRTASSQRTLSAIYFDLSVRQHFAWEVLERDAKQEPKRVVPRTDLAMAAARLGDSSRQNLLAAHHLAAAEAQSRPAHGAGQLPPWLVPDEEKKP
jgi:hypothetical protein